MADSTITITFAECVENHAGMEMFGERMTIGPSTNDLSLTAQSMIDWCKKEGCPPPQIELKQLFQGLRSSSLDASILIVRNLHAHNMNDFEDFKRLDWDTQCYNVRTGKVNNQHARYNLTFTDKQQEPDYINGKGRMYDFSTGPVWFQRLRRFFSETLHIGGTIYARGHRTNKNLLAEGNFYYDVKACYIGWHGDTERSIVAGYRMGAPFPLHYMYFVPAEGSKTLPCAQQDGSLCVTSISLNDGDAYIMSHAAVGQLWKHKAEHVRHAAGFPEVLNKTQKYLISAPTTVHVSRNMPMSSTVNISVVNVKVEHLRPRGFHTFEDWARIPGHVYIGRNMSCYISGAVASKWANPYQLKKFNTVNECLDAYNQYLFTSGLIGSIGELAGVTELGCWCKPEPCHGDVLLFHVQRYAELKK